MLISFYVPAVSCHPVVYHTLSVTIKLNIRQGEGIKSPINRNGYSFPIENNAGYLKCY